jgi:AcrR family transcriptional regulator
MASQDEPASAGHPTSKRETIARVMESALKLFSDHGFEGTSLRDIAADARVPLSSIDRYFGSKLELFDELKSTIWKEVNHEREVLIRQPISVNPDGTPTLEAVLYAFVHPVVLRGIGNPRAAPTLRLLREYVALRLHSGMKNELQSPESFASIAERWLTAVMTAEPRLPRMKAVWLLSFVISVTFSDQLQHGWYDELMPQDKEISAASLTRMIVTFCTSGIRAVAAD